MVQSLMWHWRPEPGWHPYWWQSHTWAETWAEIGFLLSMPPLLPMVVLQSFGITNAILQFVLGCLALVVGFGAYFIFVYTLVYFSTKCLLKLLPRIRKDEPVA